MNMRRWLYVFLAGFLLVVVSCGERTEKKGVVVSETSEDLFVAELDKKIKKNPDDASLYAQKGEYLLEEGFVTESLYNFLIAIEIDSTNAQTWSRLGDIYMVMENYLEAENALVRAIRLEPDNEAVLLKLAKYYLIFQNYDDVKVYLTRVLERNSLNAQAYYLWGMYNLELGDTALAVQNYGRALELDHYLYDAYISLALLYQAKGNPIAADYYQNAISVRPNYLPAQYNLAYYYQEYLERIDEAMALYDRILEQDPSYYNALYNKAYIYLVYKQDPQTALDFFRQAAEVAYPKNPDVLYNIGYCLELMGDKKQARNIYREVNQEFPNHMLTMDGLKRVGRFDWQ